jgi:hypothetical protein
MFHKLPESNLTWKDAGALRSAARTIQKSNVSRLFDLLALLGLMANVVPAAVTSSHWPAAHDVLHLPQAALLRSGRAQSFDFFQQLVQRSQAVRAGSANILILKPGL